MQARGTFSSSAVRIRRLQDGMGPASSAACFTEISFARVRGCRTKFLTHGRSGMEFVDRLLTCIDCGGEFVFTAGEQLFFMDKQFKNDPKRCKPCKSRRSAAVSGAQAANGPAAAGISRTETRTE